ncbi:ABC transporter ATP-binding protein [Camelliibacillus cellulosilyticus]|uniref:ABC transporter ATP-binding protein n=1 Tax=Camelliibacillus cellulosilyticus TaxID=2174486 RepID=A0ABV9GRA4_9BACL
MNRSILEVKRLSTSFFTHEGEIPAVRRVTFQVEPGEILGLVGESGCGKSVTSLSIMGLVPEPHGKIIEGEILFKGEDLRQAGKKRMRQIRGNDISMIYQEPMSALNPVYTIGNQLVEAIRTHSSVSKSQARWKAVEQLKMVGLPRAQALMDEYPHQLSGGMCQRVMIAMAMVCEPELLIADEPTTALDVTIQAQILDLMKRLNREKQTAMILITHDFGVVSEVCDRVVVMYAGQIVEEGDARDLFYEPKHPYTKGLIQSIPDIRTKKDRLYSIKGMVPKPGSFRNACPFAPRCPYVFDRCKKEAPEMRIVNSGQKVRCFLYDEREVNAGAGDLVKS